MALALYRKYRPRTFAEVIGQEHVTEPLSQALRSGRLHHAYLFSGPRGCGKTSSARILARSLNCEQGPTPEPCGTCASCRSLANDGAGSIDVIEIDAASHGGVDDARDLREKAFFAPASSRYKIYVIDEAHMVSSAGFNALLKLVEEPPEYVKFIFATTEPEKVLGTIRSRTHHYPFRLIPPAVLRPYLQQLTEAEGVHVDPTVFPLVVRAGGGSARDTLSVLDQLIAGAGPEGVSYARAVALLGVTDVALIDEMCDALAAGDGAAAYQTIDRVAEAGHDPRRFASDLLERFRDLIILQQIPDAVTKGLIDGPADQLDQMAAQATRLGPATLSRCADIVHNGLVEMRGTTAPRLLLELITARMLLPGADDSSGALLQRLERMERRLTLTTDFDPVRQEHASPQPTEPNGAAAAPAGSADARAAGPGGLSAGPGGGGLSAARAAAAAAGRRTGPPAAPQSSPAAPAADATAAAGAASTSAPPVAPAAQVASAAPAAAAPVAVSPAAEPESAVVVSAAADPSPVSAQPAAEPEPAPQADVPVEPVSPIAAPAPEPVPPAAAPTGAPVSSVAGPAAAPVSPAAARAPEPRRAEPAGIMPDAPDELATGADAGVPGRLSAAAIREVWPEVIRVVGRKSKKIAALAQGATVRDLEGQTVVLTFRFPAHAKMVAAEPQLIADALYEELGGRWQIRCDVAGESGPSQGTSRGPQGSGSGPGGRGAGGAAGPKAGGPARADAAQQVAPAQGRTGSAREAVTAPQAGSGDDDDGGWPEPVRPGGLGTAPSAASPAGAVPAGSAADDEDDEWPEPVRPGGNTPAAGHNADPGSAGSPEDRDGSVARAPGPSGTDGVAAAADSGAATVAGSATATPSASRQAPSPGGHAAPSPGGHAAPSPGGRAAPSPAGHAAPSPGGHATSPSTDRAAPSPAGRAAPSAAGSVRAATASDSASAPRVVEPARSTTAGSGQVATSGRGGGGAPSSGLAAARAAAARGAGAVAAARTAPSPAGGVGGGGTRPAAGPAGTAARAGGDSWSDGSPTEEAPYDPEYDGPPRAADGAVWEGFDPGDEPLDDVIDERTARQSSEQQAVQLLREAFGAEKISES
ncbi:DNA polymerase III subunit gamma and tau [Actinoplanes sp. NPDC049316]|uniref:DNA polymerase III subunit gamma and tau n=1 Tax=Actinoplanes sp. NPDC049316 TaxID=3154727 RepID=UPI00344518C2